MEGSTLGPYRIESKLGSGGMGTAWLAEAVERCAVPQGARVVLKIIHTHLLSEPGFFKRFLREAEIGKAVVHANVVRCYDADAIAVKGTQQNFLVMEYVEGQTLRDLLEELETVPEELCRHIGREVSKGLAAIHEAGVVHRDLKPENVLITPDHEVKVMDLGVARLADEAIRLSRSGAFVGSVLYASPEHFLRGGEDLDGRADLFSLGVILYELSSGAHPHPGDDFASVLARVVEEKPRRLGERNPQLSAFFEEVVHALLAKEREERFASSSKLLEVLEQGEQSTWWVARAKALRAETNRPLRRIRIPRETVVYGREEELGKLRALYEKARTGDGQVVLIEGEAGIGKTRLVDELVGRLTRDGEDLNFLFGSYPPGGAATAAGAWSTAYREHFGQEGSAPWLTETPGLVPAFDALLRGEPPPKGEEPLTKGSIQTAFIHGTRALAAERPTVVLIEDLHFAPEEGRALFSALAPEVADHRILLLGTARPGLPEEWRAHHDRIELTRLGPKDLGRLLIDAFRSERLAEELSLRIATKSDGNPFFVFEIIRGLREGQLITKRPDGTWVSTQAIEHIEIPSSVQDLIRTRIADLMEEERELLDVASCCGFAFDPGLVADALGARTVPTLRRLAHLEAKHRLVRSAGEEFVFDHHQVQETLYAALPAPLARAYHAAIGEALESRGSENPVAVCGHFLSAGRSDRAKPHFQPAVDQLRKGLQIEQMSTLLERGLEAGGFLGGAERIDALLRLDRCLYILGRFQEKWQVLAEALELSDREGDPVRRAQVRAARGDQHEALDQRSEAVPWFEEALAIAEEAGALTEQAQAGRALAISRWTAGRNDDALRLLTRALEAAKVAGDLPLEARITGNIGLVLAALGRVEEAREHHERDFRLETENGLVGAGARAAANLGDVCAHLGDLSASKRHLEYHEQRVIRNSYRPGQAFGKVGLGSVHLRLGDLETAGRQLRAGKELLSAMLPGTDWAASAAFWQGEWFLVIGDPGNAEQSFREALEIWAELGDVVNMNAAKRRLAMLALREDRREEAVALLRESAESSRQAGDDEGRVLCACHLATLDRTLLETAVRDLEEKESRLSYHARMEARFLLWRAAGDPTHLREAHRSLCHLRDHAPEEYRETMIENVPLNREIMAAWKEHGAAN